MRGGLKIGRVFGIPIYLHTSWFLFFLLITYYFAGDFASRNPQWAGQERWPVAALASLLFFGSLLFHELSHSVVARHYRIPVASITLFIFGGVARITRDPDRAGQEFLIAAAGPASSYVLAGAFGLASLLTPAESLVHQVAFLLAWINFGLATFNLVPGFPLDGGRILRSIVWGVTKNFTRSTRIAARSGQVIACGMIAMGALFTVQAYTGGGDVLNGLWWVFIGWFLLTTARQSYAQVNARSALEGLRAADLMTGELPTVGRDLSLDEYSQEVARTGRRAHLVMADGQLVGVMTIEALQAVPRDQWTGTSVQAAMLTQERVQWTSPDEPALELLDRMRQAQVDQMAVIAGGNVVGLVTRDSILRAVQTRNDLGHLTGHS